MNSRWLYFRVMKGEETMQHSLNLVKEALLIKNYGMALRNAKQAAAKIKKGSLKASYLESIKQSILYLKKTSLTPRQNTTDVEKHIQLIDSNIDLIER